MTPSQFLLLALVVCAILFVLKIQQKRELANAIAKRYCEQNELQLLDDTVAFRGVHLNWVQLALVFRFHFEYSTNRSDRYPGSVSIIGTQTQSIFIEQDHIAP